ncbi:MAG TPA: glutamate--tRNA ligase, partial [Thermoanaerobaculia bacterium]|nr:glutamate--tRNA ligase [Thermoanaerobaculia bacterium]
TASPAVFDREKLLWMNSQYMSRHSTAELMPHLQTFLEQAGLADAGPERLAATLELHRTRARTLKEMVEQVLPYFRESLEYDAAACAKFLKDPALPELLETLRDRYAALPEFTKEALEAGLRALSEERGVKAGVLIHPVRMALSGAAGGPPLFDLVEVMGREASRRHLDRFLGYLRAGNAATGFPG